MNQVLAGTAESDAIEENESFPSGHYIACGKKGGCGDDNKLKAADDQVHHFRCVREGEVKGWKRQDTCKTPDLYAKSEKKEKIIYADAEAFCKGQDGRLPTLEELEADCTKGSGAGLDKEKVWSSTPWTDKP